MTSQRIPIIMIMTSIYWRETPFVSYDRVLNSRVPDRWFCKQDVRVRIGRFALLERVSLFF
jgi:hypothetical protein